MSTLVPSRHTQFSVAFTTDIAESDFRYTGYLIVQKLGLRMLRDPYSSKPNVLWYAYSRIGGQVALTDSLKLMKIST